MRDDHYRNLCENPRHYDALIDFIKAHSPYCSGLATEEEREEFATCSVNSSISAVCFGNVGSFSTTGGACAILMVRGEKRTVWLSFDAF